MLTGCRAALIVLAISIASGAARGESLEEAELAALDRYLAQLAAGQPASAARVDQLADVSYAGLRRTMEAYVALEEPIEGHTHRAFQALLERMSRTALAPWPMVKLYSPEFAKFLTTPVAENALAEKLFQRLKSSAAGRQAFDLAVRLTPEASLRRLAANKGPRAELLEAWNRRLAERDERRPIPRLADMVDEIANNFSPDMPPGELAALLRFVGAWPAKRPEFEGLLVACLSSPSPPDVLAALEAQQQTPALLNLNEEVIARFLGPSAGAEVKKEQAEKIVEHALRNYAFDAEHDHSATLRRLWPTLKKSQAKLRYACLYSLGLHPRGNDQIALAAVREQAYDLIDVAMPVLAAGDPAKAEQAVRHVLTKGTRGHEEALRLARSLKLAGFVPEALAIAGDRKRDQVLRQTALAYLQLADGTARRKLLPMLAEPNADLRLSAIQMFSASERLTPDDKNDIAPALIRVAQDDVSFGHRQDAIFALSRWRDKQAAPFFELMLEKHTRVLLVAGHYNDERYWQYRLRLVSLTGLAALGQQSARNELATPHDKGGPTEKMDVLLSFIELGEVPPFAFDDLAAEEPKLVATAAFLIHEHGDPDQRRRLHETFSEAPLWREFLRSGIDDHNILRFAGLVEEVGDE